MNQVEKEVIVHREEIMSSNLNPIKGGCRGTWVAQSVKLPTLAQVMRLQFVSSSPAQALC